MLGADTLRVSEPTFLTHFLNHLETSIQALEAFGCFRLQIRHVAALVSEWPLMIDQPAFFLDDSR